MTENKYCKAITRNGWLCTNHGTCQEYCTVHKKQHSYECVVCYEKTNKPFRLKCKHTVCNDCFIKWCEKCEDNNAKVSCPICRHDSSKEWLVYIKNIVNHRNNIWGVCEQINKMMITKVVGTGDYSKCKVFRTGEYSKCMETHAKLFTLVLSKPSFLAMNPAFYDIFKIRIEIFFNSIHGSISQKIKKMFGAFNEKYYTIKNNELY